MKLETNGRRIYFIDFPFATKDAIRAIGGSWDANARAWWIGTAKRPEAEALLQRLTATKDQLNFDVIDPNAALIVSSAKYKGQSYYCTWSGPKEGVQSAWLCFRDGSKKFWAEGPELELGQPYRSKRSINDLKAYAERKQREAKTGVCECRCHSRADCACPHFCHVHHDGCDACGCES